jgi:urease accessory protein
MKNLHKTLLLVGLATASVAAHAHTGHGTTSLMEGLVHPFGADHLLAMVAVGVWSTAALPTRHTWQGPAAFLAALAGSAVLGALGLTLPYLEHAIALSVVLFGAMLCLSRYNASAAWGLGLVAAAASLHGLAHGAEAPSTGFGGYALGFMLTTASLHTGGVCLGLAIRRGLQQRRGLALAGVGTLLGGAGVYLFTQV